MISKIRLHKKTKTYKTSNNRDEENVGDIKIHILNIVAHSQDTLHAVSAWMRQSLHIQISEAKPKF